MTIADISRTTKIPIHLLEAIERNDVDRLPQRFFTRAFVRAYAKEVGVDPGRLLDNFEQDAIERVEMDVPMSNVTIDDPASSRSPLFLLALGVACSIYFGFASKTAAPEPQVGIANQLQLADRTEVVAAAPHPATTDVVFEIQSNGGCLVAVTADGQPVMSRLVASGEPVTVKARGEIILRVGDTGTCATAAPAARTILTARQETVSAPTENVAAIGAANMTIPVTHVVADDQVVVSSSAAESLPTTSDATITPPDQTPPSTPVELF